MKKVGIIIALCFMLALCLVFTACGGGDDEVDVKGTYTLTTTKNETQVVYTIVIGDNSVTLSYQDATSQTVTYSGTYSVDGNVVTVDYTADSESKQVVLLISGNSISVQSGELAYTVVIPTPTSYTVTFKADDVTIGTPQTVSSGSSATAPTAPTKTGYRFAGWDVSFENVTGDITVNALFVKIYTVKFMDGETELDSQTVDTGEDATAPTSPEKAGYRFDGWDKTFTNVTADLVVNAEFVQTFTVTFKADGETVGTPQVIDTGSSATAPTDPTKTNYIFLGWDKAFTNVTADLVVNAEFALDQNLFYVTETVTGDTVVVKIEVKGSTVLFNTLEASLNYTGLTYVSHASTFLLDCYNVAEQNKVNMLWMVTVGNRTASVVVVEITFTATGNYSYEFLFAEDGISYDNGGNVEDAPYTIIY